jgi:RNA-directed DNA polymerase
MTDNSSIDLSLTNIWCAWVAFRCGKKPSREIRGFEQELEYNLLRLCSDLHTGQYDHGGYYHRIVNEKKRRDIAVASVRDRVVHRLLYDYLVPLVDARLDYDVWSCRQGKGLHEALRRTQHLLHSYGHGWAWRADISKFFDHVDHGVLKECLLRFTTDETAQKLLDKVIGSYAYNGQSVSQSVSQSVTAWYSDWQFDQPDFRKYLPQ